MSFLTGKNKSKQESKNLAYPYIQDTFGSTAGATGGTTNALMAMLGLGGDSAAQQTALDNFSNSAGMDFLRDQGTKAITSSKAASGLLQSGSFGTALQNFGQGLAKTFLPQYMDNLFKLGNQGLQAGNLITDAGRVSSGSSSQKPGLGGLIGGALAGLPMGG